MKSVAVFCGSSSGTKPVYSEVAVELGRILAEREITLVYGGGKVGLMGTVADAALVAGGQVIGVIPQSLLDREIGHRGVSELIVTTSMHERKATMERLAEGFVALPGGVRHAGRVLRDSDLGSIGSSSETVRLARYRWIFRQTDRVFRQRGR